MFRLLDVPTFRRSDDPVPTGSGSPASLRLLLNFLTSLLLYFIASFLLPAIQGHLSVHDDSDIPPRRKKLHHLVSRARQLRPARFRFRILLQPSQRLPLKHKIHFAQTFSRRLAHRERLPVQLDLCRAFHQRLPPHFHHCLFQRHGPGFTPPPVRRAWDDRSPPIPRCRAGYAPPSGSARWAAWASSPAPSRSPTLAGWAPICTPRCTGTAGPAEGPGLRA